MAWCGFDRSVWTWGAAAILLASCAQTGSSSPAAPVAPASSSRASAHVCADLSFPIYFELASDRLTSEARQVIADGAAQVRGCRLGSLDVVGLADARNTAHRALLLSERRAVVVADTMKAAGLPAPNFQLEAKGKQGARTERGFRELLRHRVDVTIHAAPPVAAPPVAAPAAGT